MTGFLTLLVLGARYLVDHFPTFLRLLQEQLLLVFVSELAAIAVAVPLGVLSTRDDRVKRITLGFGSVAQTVPTLAILALVFPFLGLGFKPALVGLFLYALMPILINTVTGIEDVSEDTIDAARGMGMTDVEILRRIQLPLAIPVIFAGIRTSAVINMGTAYLAYFIGGGGLGLWVVSGIQLFNMPQVLAGAIPGALIAIGLDVTFAAVERRLGGEGINRGLATAG